VKLGGEPVEVDGDAAKAGEESVKLGGDGVKVGEDGGKLGGSCPTSVLAVLRRQC
jgi:hypothetical protein